VRSRGGPRRGPPHRCLRRPLQAAITLVVAGIAAGPAFGALPAEAPPAAFRAEPALPAPAGWPFGEHFPRTSGTGRLKDGALFWSDFIYDDHGALGVPPAANFGITNPIGTYRYPAGPPGHNGADIFRAGVARRGDLTWWRVDWNTLLERDVPIAAWAIDIDDDPSTGTGAWGAGTGLTSAGIDKRLIVSAKGAWIEDADGRRTPIAEVGGRMSVDLQARSFIAVIPSHLLAAGPRSRVRLAAGLANASGDGFAAVSPDLGAAPGQPAAYNVAFRSHDQETGHWMDQAQATALALNDASAFSAEVRWADLSARRSTLEPQPVGYSNRWYASSVELGQGVLFDEAGPDQKPNLLGRVQPYSVYVPRSYRPGRPAPVTFLLHALNLNHNQFGVSNPRFIQLACERRGAICVAPEGRGPDGYTQADAEVDFFEVWNRVARDYAVDPDQTSIAGYSMGGFGTYRQSLLYPDLFARAAVLAGPPTCGIRVVPGVEAKPEPAFNGKCVTDGDMTPLVTNARWIPFYMANAGADELVPVTSAILQAQRFEDLGYRFRFDLYPAQDHATWWAEDAFDEAAGQLDGRRVAAPGRITYVLYPNLVEAQRGVGPTAAYWLRGIAARKVGPGSIAQVDAASHARPDPAVSLEQRTGAVVPGAVTPGVSREQRWVTSRAPHRRALVEVALTNVRRVSLQMSKAGFKRGRLATVSIKSDGASTVALEGLARGARVVVDHKRPIRANRRGRVVARLDGGNHVLRVLRR
jgi:dienelactone hydrolase